MHISLGNKEDFKKSTLFYINIVTVGSKFNCTNPNWIEETEVIL